MKKIAEAFTMSRSYMKRCLYIFGIVFILLVPGPGFASDPLVLKRGNFCLVVDPADWTDCVSCPDWTSTGGTIMDGTSRGWDPTDWTG